MGAGNGSEEQVQTELNRVVEEGMMNISIAGELPVIFATRRAMANIYNAEANHYIFKVLLTMDETGQTVYESGGIAPGQYIQYIELDPVPEKGEYEATAIEHQLVGSVSTKVMLCVT